MDRPQQAPPPVDVARLNLLIVGVLLTALSLFVVVKTMRGGVNDLIAAIVLIGGVIWVVSGRQVWWLPIPIATSIGGLIWVGFRIYSHEIAVLMAAMALLPALAINRRALEQYRPALSWIVYALPLYLLVHLFASLVFNRLSGGTGYGNIFRTYMTAIWALFFVIGIYHYGNSRLIRRTIILVYIGLLFRVVVGLYSYYFPGYIFFRGFDVFFLLSEHGSMELRDAPMRLLILSLGLSMASRNFGATVFHLIVALLSVWLLLMGSGRVTVGMLGVVPIFWLLIQRRYMLLLLALGAMISVILFLNANPGVLYLLPEGPQRALTILIFGDVLDIQARLAGSNLWHQELFQLGKARWLATPVSFLFGNRVYPFDPTMGGYSYDFYHSVQVAASIAKYERSLWTILATTGLAGGLLYAGVFFALLRGPVRSLFRNQIVDFTHAVYFFAAMHSFLFLLFCPFSGSFPGVELMWAGIAFALYQDAKMRERELASVPDTTKPRNQILKPY